MDPVIAEQLGRGHPLARHLDDFLTDLANAGTSPHTRRAHRGDLLAFAAHHGEETGELTATPIRAYLAELAEPSPARRKRKRAAIASFTRWAVRHDLLGANPMDRIDTIKVPKALSPPGRSRRRGQGPRGDLLAAPARGRAVGPVARPGAVRDRLRVRRPRLGGLRAVRRSLDLRLDDEHVRIHGEGGSVRTVLLDDRGYVALLKLYLARAGYTAGASRSPRPLARSRSVAPLRTNRWLNADLRSCRPAARFRRIPVAPVCHLRSAVAPGYHGSHHVTHVLWILTVAGRYRTISTLPALRPVVPPPWVSLPGAGIPVAVAESRHGSAHRARRLLGQTRAATRVGDEREH